MTLAGHQALSDRQCPSPRESFKSSLGHCTNVALTRVNSQSHCRSRGLAQLVHNIAGARSVLCGQVWAGVGCCASGEEPEVRQQLRGRLHDAS